jgi:alkylation response protein AidB-like acyl-CoA dehydrogenase
VQLRSTPEQIEARRTFRSFAEKAVGPGAGRFDREQELPEELIRDLARAGLLGATIPAAFGGGGCSAVVVGLLHEELGRACSSTRSLLTVHSMVAHAIERWGSEEQRRCWLPQLASGDRIAAFGLSEDEVGSDASAVQATATREADTWVLRGEKKWISFGQRADVILVFASTGNGPGAFLVETAGEGVEIEPIRGMLGLRASMLARIRLDGCRVPAANAIGRIGFGVSHVAASSLELGRLTVAWGCIGIAQACLEACAARVEERRQFGVPIGEHQLVRRRLSRMMVGTRSARLLAYQAAWSRDHGSASARQEGFMAKYLASTTATRVASDAVQIFGALGCSQESPIERLFRDARVMEIIEGTTEIQEIVISRYARREVDLDARAC